MPRPPASFARRDKHCECIKLGKWVSPPCSEAGKPCAYLHLSGCQCNLDLERNNCRASVALCHREVLHACISRDYKNITITSFFLKYYPFVKIHFPYSSVCLHWSQSLRFPSKAEMKKRGRWNKTLFYLSVRILATGQVRTSASSSENVLRKGVGSANSALTMVAGC